MINKTNSIDFYGHYWCSNHIKDPQIWVSIKTAPSEDMAISFFQWHSIVMILGFAIVWNHLGENQHKLQFSHTNQWGWDKFLFHLHQNKDNYIGICLTDLMVRLFCTTEAYIKFQIINNWHVQQRMWRMKMRSN